MKQFLKTALFGLLVIKSALAVTVKDQKGDFTLDKTPKRVIALEYSYVDALAQVGVSPVGVADDKDPTRILEKVRKKIKPWTSVGTRAAPSLEAIAMLKPDLIIADENRHNAVYEELKKIAPTVIFNSRTETYQENLETAQKIGDLVGKSRQMKTRINSHKKRLASIVKDLPKGLKTVFGTSRENQFGLYNDLSYAGSLLKQIGLDVTKATEDKKTSHNIGLEQLVAEKPEFLIIAHYRDESIARKWEKEPLYKLIPAVKNNKILSVDPNVWTRARGIEAAEMMASEVAKFLK